MMRKLEKMLKDYKKLTESSVEVGIINGDRTYKDGQKIIDIATYHEYGKGVPKRSFINLTFDKAEKNGKAAALSALVYDQVLFKNKNVTAMLNKAGTVLVSWVKETIDRHGYGEWQKLDPKTENRKKRKNAPLVDTMELYNSIDYKIIGGD